MQTFIKTLIIASLLVTASCHSGDSRYEKVLIGTWRMNEMSRYTIEGSDTTLVKRIPVSASDYHILIFRPDHTLEQRMRNQTSKGKWSLNGTSLHLDIPYYNDQRSEVIRELNPQTKTISISYATGDTMLFITRFIKSDSSYSNDTTGQ